MGDHFQEHRPALTSVTSGGQRFTQATLDHTHDRLDLPSLTVTTPFAWTLKVPSHYSAIITARRFRGRAANGWWDDRRDA